MRYVKYTIEQLKNISEDKFISDLFLHTENRSISEDTSDDMEKIASWKDCLSFLNSQFNMARNNTIGEVSICFEYQIFDGTWIDAVIVCKNKLIILEFKSGTDCRQETLDSHRTQVIGYYNKITHCNRVIWEEMRRNPSFTVDKYLVYTNPRMKGNTAPLGYIKVTDDFQDIIGTIEEIASDERVEQLLEFEMEMDITTTGVMRDILNRHVLSDMYVQDDNVEACAAIVERISEQATRQAINLIFIKGDPGTGKTGTGFSLLEKYIDKGAKYVTGNGNLSLIFKQMIKADEIGGTEAAIVGSLHDIYNVANFCKRHNHADRSIGPDKCDNKILIIDEAQRVWNPIQLALSPKNKLNDADKAFVIKHEVSEALLVLRAVLQSCVSDMTSKTVIFLMGSGQEIYIGEEDGERYIKKAVEHVQKTIDQMSADIAINVYAPTEEMKNEYEGVSTKCEYIPKLLLDKNKRSEFNQNALKFVNDLVDTGSGHEDDIQDAFYVYNDYAAMIESVNTINTGAFTVGIIA